MRIKYKQRCIRCKKNYVLMSGRQEYAVCYDCQKKELDTEIDDPKMKKFFDVPEKYYKDNSFLRKMKINYLRYGNLTEKQRDAFIKIVKQLDDPNVSSKDT